jgi:hypothetical protein
MAREIQSREYEVGQGRAYAGGIVRYDGERRRVWVCGQRLHHGLTGALLTAAGIALMAHDRRDRAIWFRLGS